METQDQMIFRFFSNGKNRKNRSLLLQQLEKRQSKVTPYGKAYGRIRDEISAERARLFFESKKDS